MEFLARHYEDILLDYRFIRAIGVQVNLKFEPAEGKRCDPTWCDPAGSDLRFTWTPMALIKR